MKRLIALFLFLGLALPTFAAQIFQNGLIVSNGLTLKSGTFTGNGAGLTNVPPAADIVLSPSGGDDTAQLQSAINMITNGSVNIFVKRGIYTFGQSMVSTGTYNSQITIPAITNSASQPTLTILGFNAPRSDNESAEETAATHSVFKSTLTNQAFDAAFISSPHGGRNSVHIRIENMVFLLPPNPTYSCLNFADNSDVELRSVMVEVSGGYTQSTRPQPTYPNSYGIILPQNNNSASVRMDRATVVGFYTGCKVGELLRDGNFTAHMCVNALELTAAHHNNQFLFVGDYECGNGIVVSGGPCYADFQEYDIETVTTLYQGWMRRTNDIYDPSSLLRGKVRFLNAPENSIDDSLTIFGGTNVSCEHPSRSVGASDINSSGLIGKWVWREGTGYTSADLSGNGSTAVLSNSAVWVNTGTRGNAIGTTPNTGPIGIPDSAILNPTNSVSVCMWVKPVRTQAAYAKLFTKFSPSIGDSYLTLDSSSDGQHLRGIVASYGATNLAICTASSAMTANWTFVVLTYNGTTAALYVNGASSATTNTAFPIAGDSTSPVVLGGSSSGAARFYGQIGETRIYNRALTASDVLALYQYRKELVSFNYVASLGGFSSDDGLSVLSVKTNAAPTGVTIGTTAPDVWMWMTNNGVGYAQPFWGNH